MTRTETNQQQCTGSHQQRFFVEGATMMCLFVNAQPAQCRIAGLRSIGTTHCANTTVHFFTGGADAAAFSRAFVLLFMAATTSGPHHSLHRTAVEQEERTRKGRWARFRHVSSTLLIVLYLKLRGFARVFQGQRHPSFCRYPPANMHLCLFHHH